MVLILFFCRAEVYSFRIADLKEYCKKHTANKLPYTPAECKACLIDMEVIQQPLDQEWGYEEIDSPQESIDRTTLEYCGFSYWTFHNGVGFLRFYVQN